MESTQMLDRPPLGRHGEPCPACGAPMAQDQRYCLACGSRRAGLPAILSGPSELDPAAATATAMQTEPELAAPAGRRNDATLAAGVACLLLALLVGVLIGRSGREGTQAAAPPQVVTVAGAATPAPSTGTAPASFTSDWPEGKRGFTIALRTLPKDGTDTAAVAAAKQELTTAGAPDVGVLDSDAHGSLDPGEYVIFSGQFADRKAAKAALAGLAAKFPDARVVEVSSGAAAADAGSSQTEAPSAEQQAEGAKAIQDLENTSPEEYQKKSAKLPKQLTTPGKLPPKDDKPAGGGGDSQTFK